MRRTNVAIAGCFAVMVGCVGIDDGTAPCSPIGDCLPDYTCAVGYCVPLERRPDPVGVGPEGGEVAGRQGAKLLVPPRAIRARTQLSIDEGNPISNMPGLFVMGVVHIVEPAGMYLDREATILIPVDAELDGVHVWRWDVDNRSWRRLDGVSERGLAVGKTDRLGHFIAARPR